VARRVVSPHDHAHREPGTAAGRHLGRLAWTLALTASFVVVEVVGGLWTGSLALLADAGHMLADVGGLVLSLLAVWFARRPPSPRNTYGYLRLEILAALANGVVLLVVAGVILYEAYRRFLAPVEILTGPMLVIAVVGLAVNVIGILLLRAGSRESLNVQSAYLEVLSDALGSAAVILAAVVIGATGAAWVDPAASAAIGLFILPRTWRLLGLAVHVLLEGVPPHLDLREIERAISGSHGVRAVHDLHVWTVTSGREALSAHVRVDDLADGRHVLGDLQHLLRERFGIEHVTIQLEADEPLLQIGGASSARGDPADLRSGRSTVTPEAARETEGPGPA
jgi:cobalt-zinc-cadmium efflux system protein